MTKFYNQNKVWFKFKRLALLFLIMLPFQNCGEFTSSNLGGELSSEESDAVIIATGKTLYARNCAGCHGPIDTSSKLGRGFTQISWSIANIPQMSILGGLDEGDISYIARALIFEAEGGGTETNDNGRTQFVCDNNAISKTPLHKLSNREFRNSLNALLDSFSSNLKNDSNLNNLYSLLPNDAVAVEGNTVKEQAKLVSQEILVAFFEASFRASILVSQNSTGLTNFPNTNRCLSNSNLDSSCHRLFVRELASRAFRKNLNTAEANSLADSLWNNSLSKEEQVQASFTGITNMPEFLYKAYNSGSPVSGASNTLQLSPHDLAAKLSYFLTGSPPDQNLRNLASSGQITDNNILSAEVDRLLARPEAQATVIRMFRESYGYELYDSFNYPNDFRDSINTNNLQQAMNSELDYFFSNEILSNDSSFSGLFTSVNSRFNHGGLAEIYGISNPSNSTVQLPAERSGFLNRAAMLTKRSGRQASPIKRGLKVLENVLCVDVGEPPPSAPTSLPDLGNDILSTRDHTFRTSQVENTACATCHSRMNPLGYAFEGFDTLGRTRSLERVFDNSGREIASVALNTQDSSDELEDGTSVSFRNSVDLSSSLGESDNALLCFAKQLKAFESREEVHSTDNCQMNEVLNTLYGQNGAQGSIKEAIKSLVLSDKFKLWSY